MIQREWQRVDPRFLDDDEQRFWATIAGRQIRFDQRAEFARKFTEGRAEQGRARDVPLRLRRREPEPAPAHDGARGPRRDPGRARRLRRPRHARHAGAAVGEGPAAGVRILLRAIGDGKATAPDQILGRWTWRLARSVRKTLDRKASQEFPEAKRLLGAVANSRGHRHEENVAQLVGSRRRCRLPVGAALLASAEGYTPRANGTLDRAREELGPIAEIATALAENLPAPKAPARKSRRRRRKKEARRGAGARRAGDDRRRVRPAERRGRLARRGCRQADAGGRAARARRATARAASGAARPAGSSGRRRCSSARAGTASARPRATRRWAARRPRRRLDRVGALLELLDVGLRVSASEATASLTCSAYSLSASSSSVMSIGAPSRSPEPHAERLRRARARRERHVVRHGRPEADRAEARRAARVVEDADDPGRPLVAGELEPELLDERRVGRRAGHGRGTRVRHVGEQRAERHDELDAEVLRQADDEVGERAPAVVRLDAERGSPRRGRCPGSPRGRRRSRATRSGGSGPRRA